MYIRHGRIKCLIFTIETVGYKNVAGKAWFNLERDPCDIKPIFSLLTNWLQRMEVGGGGMSQEAVGLNFPLKSFPHFTRGSRCSCLLNLTLSFTKGFSLSSGAGRGDFWGHYPVIG